MKNTIDFYDDTARSWADRWYNIETFMPYLKMFMTCLPNNPRIIDLCCGTGYDSMRLSHLGARVIGLDLSQKALEIAKEKNPHLDFYRQNILQDYSYVGKVDGILCCAGLIHIKTEELGLAFRQMAKVVRHPGALFLVVYDGMGLREDWRYITIDGTDYERLFYRHTLAELTTASEGLFSFSKELDHAPDEMWRYYIFKADVTAKCQ